MEIWRQIVRDGEAGAERLVSEYGDRLFAASILLCHDESEAEDLVFRTLDRAIRKISSYRPTGSFFAWLYATMLNFRRMDMRRKRPEAAPPEEMERLAADPWRPGTPESPPEAADRDAVRDAVLFGGMFWLGSLAPSSDEDGEKTSKGGLFARAKDAPKRK